MAKHVVHSCDKCGSRKTIYQFQYVIGSSSDGIENTWDWKTTDICGVCLGRVVARLLARELPEDKCERIFDVEEAISLLAKQVKYQVISQEKI